MLHCPAETCDGDRLFDATDRRLTKGQTNQIFINYFCRNCKVSRKTFSLLLSTPKAGESLEAGNAVVARKFGEIPGFGTPTPARVMTLIGSEREYFLKGRRAENQGMGIAAFAYYRRVVERKKGEIFDQIIRVTQLVGADPSLVAELECAKKETQFSKAVDTVRHAIPQALLLAGQNPLTLLHSALSEGLHAQTDEECLELAASIRIVLTEFVERVTSALKDEKQLKDAVNLLIRARAPKPSAA
jgi:hypothetical protein